MGLQKLFQKFLLLKLIPVMLYELLKSSRAGGIDYLENSTGSKDLLISASLFTVSDESVLDVFGQPVTIYKFCSI